MKFFKYLWVFGIGIMTAAGASAQEYLPAVQLGAPADSRTILVPAEIVQASAVNCGACKVKIGTPVCGAGCREQVVAVPCPGGCEKPTCKATPVSCGPAVKIVATAPCAAKICSPCAAAPARAASCDSCKATPPRPARPILDWLARLFQGDRQRHAASPCDTGTCGNSVAAPVQPVPAAVPSTVVPSTVVPPTVVPAIPLPNLPPPMPRAISHTEAIAPVPVPAAVAPYSPYAPNAPR